MQVDVRKDAVNGTLSGRRRSRVSIAAPMIVNIQESLTVFMMVLNVLPRL